METAIAVINDMAVYRLQTMLKHRNNSFLNITELSNQMSSIESILK